MFYSAGLIFHISGYKFIGNSTTKNPRSSRLNQT
ncbi:uncharacterized protein METZ01_LOCUS30 [marine metagenome]|uniref:Uncharacterized protein n=1 Tax=marine metagenome TaxID=408172 RepID=A0A381MXX6_9ZZZZ